jgi:hypothetical protein
LIWRRGTFSFPLPVSCKGNDTHLCEFLEQLRFENLIVVGAISGRLFFHFPAALWDYGATRNKNRRRI